MTEPKGSTVIPADRIEIAIGWQFHQLAFDSQSNRLETKLLSAVTRIDWWTDRPSETVFRVEKSEVSDLSRPGGNESDGSAVGLRSMNSALRNSVDALMKNLMS